MKRRIQTLLIAFLIGLTGSVAVAQTVEELDQFERWRKEQEAQFRQFIEERDRAFADFLKQQWEEMQLSQGIVPDDKPKPIRVWLLLLAHVNRLPLT